MKAPDRAGAPHTERAARAARAAPATPAAAAALAPVLIGCGPAMPTRPPPPEAIGFKAHNLARMAALGLPVPAAFVLGTAWSAMATPPGATTWTSALRALEQASGAVFGDRRHPLLVSVRSGAPVSMPGMMDTLLNIGLCEATLPGFLRTTGNPALVWDAYRRLVAGYGEVVMGVAPAAFEADLQRVAGGRDERELDFAERRELARAHLATVASEAGRPFPQDPSTQLETAVRAVLASWHGEKAVQYRRIHGLPETLGTAVTVQRMVFGNAGGTSGAGVGFTRHPSTGEPLPWVDFLFNAQGEDVVSGRRRAGGHEALAAAAPTLWNELLQSVSRLERAFADMQDFEFTVETGRLWLLQTRSGKRTAQACARIALDLLDEGLIEPDEARRRTAGLDAAALTTLHVVAEVGAGVQAAQPLQPLAQAVSAAHGVAIGEIVLDEAAATACHAAGRTALLVRQDAETRDIAALESAAGLLTARGARTSHAAVVARQMGKVCLVGCETLHIDPQRRRISLGGVEMAEGETLTLDGHAGAIYRGAARTEPWVPPGLLERLERLRG